MRSSVRHVSHVRSIECMQYLHRTVACKGLIVVLKHCVVS